MLQLGELGATRLELDSLPVERRRLQIELRKLVWRFIERLDKDSKRLGGVQVRIERNPVRH